MAILYGTQNNGETLAVQVNEFGQLVAQGLDGATGPEGPEGPQGPQGPQGEPGIDGTVQPIYEEFVPYLDFNNGGTAIIEYSQQSGLIVRWGNYVECTGVIRTSSVVITDARGKIRLLGLPTIDSGIDGTAKRSTAAVLGSFGFSNTIVAQLRITAQGNRCSLYKRASEGWFTEMSTSDLSESSNATDNYLAFKVWGELVDPDTLARREKIAETLAKRFSD